MIFSCKQRHCYDIPCKRSISPNHLRHSACFSRGRSKILSCDLTYIGAGVTVWNVNRSRTTSLYHRFMNIARASCMSNFRATFRLAAYQSGMYIRSRMSSHLVLSFVYVRIRHRLTSSMTSLYTVTAKTMREPCIL